MGAKTQVRKSELFPPPQAFVSPAVPVGEPLESRFAAGRLDIRDALAAGYPNQKTELIKMEFIAAPFS